MSASDQVLTSLASDLTEQAKVQASLSAMLRAGFLSVSTAVNDAEALEMKRFSGAPVGGDKGPATLAEYCKPQAPATEIAEGTKVKANWEGYGTNYPGKVKEENSDGTVDIKYDDGFTEKNVDPDDFRVRKKQGKNGAAKQAAKPRDDPACKLQEFLKKLQDQLKDLNKMISEWLSSQRAKIAGDKKPPPRAKPLAAAPGAAPPGAETSDDLEKLKEQLAEREDYIKELEKQAKENDDALQKLSPTTPAPQGGATSIDNLIAQFKAQIAQRDARIEDLLELIRAQEEELASIGAKQLSLKDIDDAVKALEQDVEAAKKKRDELKKDGSLDPELRAVIDSIIKALEKLRSKVDNLIALEAKARADRENAEREADEAAAAARKKAEAEGKDADKAAAEAAEKAQKDSAEKVKKADLETMKAAQEVQGEMQEAEKGASKLDTGLHPHGAKWWRYRYERSYIEALIMIFISFLMLLWSVLIRKLKEHVDVWALPPGQAPKTDCEEMEEETHGGVYVLWLHLLSEQMMVCVLVFLTVWLIAKTHLAEVFPLIIQPSEDMRVPSTGEEYRQMALDICTIFFFAIMFYFSLIFAVAHDTWNMTNVLEEFESSPDPASSTASKSLVRKTEQRKTASAQTLGGVAATGEDFEVLKRHFIKHMDHEAKTSDDPIHAEINQLLGGDNSKFPLWKYLKFEVRSSVAQLFHFGWSMWLPVISMFVVLMCLHRFAHMGYVRIMGFFALVTLLVIVGMGWYTKSMNRAMQEDKEPADMSRPTKKTWHNKFQTENIFLGVLQFAMFFVCYGVARMICQPWMWELHFWPVFSLTLVAILSAFLFVWLVSPAIPSFCALQAIPPYVDDENLQTMRHIAQTYAAKGKAKGF